MAEAISRAIAEMESAPWVGRSIPRVEDAALLTGRGRFIDDLGAPPGTLHAAMLRSPHAHADIVAIDATAARRAPGVVAVIDGADIKAMTASLVVGVKAPVECWPIAVGRVRYVGEPVAVVVATDRYLAEDAVDLIEARYAIRPAVVDPLTALDAAAPVLHDGFGGNVASDRSFSYGDPVQAFAVGGTPHQPRHPLSPQFLHADRNLRRGRRLRCGRGCLSMYWPISRAHSASMRCWRGRCGYPAIVCGCAHRRIPVAASESSRASFPISS